MIPAIKRLYPLKADQVAALKRHLVFFNTTPAVCGPVIGVTAAMEEARANGAAIDDGAINGIKVGLMGPLAGVGDPLVWGHAAADYRGPWRLAGPLRQHSGTFVIFLYFQCSAAGNEVVRPATGLP